MSIYTPDLSGMDWSYYISTYQRTIFRYAQKVMFEVPVYQNERLEVVRIGVTNRVLNYGVDYIVYDDDIDYDAISVCKNIDPSFDKILLKSLTLLINTDASFKIQVRFNQLFADYINYARINQHREIEVTPTLVSNMVEQLSYLQQMVLDSSTDGYSHQSAIVKMALNEYPNGDNDENLIIDEEHDLNTLENRCLIRPIYGAFFKDSVMVVNSLTNDVYTVDTDYQILDLDISRTKTTGNLSGVYRIIKILKDTVGSVKVNYRAYGGVADVASMRMVQDRVKVIEDYLARTSYVTPKTLPADPTIIGIRNKLQEMEGTMRLLLQNGLPSYGDVSSGTAVLKKITAQDSNLHWWSIATLYRVEGSADDILADVFKFRLKSLYSKMMFECVVTVNVDTESKKRFDVYCTNSTLPERVLELYCPKLRILEVNAGGVYSGIVLQLGMKLGAGLLQETFDIEDMSGRESCWKLVPFRAESVPPEDTAVLMPNQMMTFSYGDPTSKVDEVVIPFPDGMDVLIPETNFPLSVGSMSSQTVGITENYDMLVTELKNVEMSKVRMFRVSMIVNVGNLDEKIVDFDVLINSRDDVSKRWAGKGYIEAGFGSYLFEVRYWRDGDGSHHIGYYVMSSNQTTTLNVVATKIMF